MDRQLEQLAQFVAAANTVEGVTRPLLALLQRITGLESTYLTAIDETANLLPKMSRVAGAIPTRPGNWG